MAVDLNPDDTSRFADLEILTTTYKTVSDHPITTNVLIPKRLLASPSPSPSPVLLRYHGGGFIAASSLFPPFFQPWHFALADRHAAVIVSPNYRLAPESTIDDLLSDIEDHWTWLHTSLPAFVAQQTGGRVAVDVTRVLAAGDSAGGYLSLMTGLRHPDGVRACAAAYPCTDLRDPHFTEPARGPTLGVGPLPYGPVEEHLRRVREGSLPAVVSDDGRFERGGLMFALAHAGLAKHLFPSAARHLFPFDVLDDGARFPRGGVFVWHGEEDSLVPVVGSRRLAEKVREVDPELDFRLAVRPGEHGFDHESEIDEEWMAEGLERIVKSWLE